jgi:hypothetical protein
MARHKNSDPNASRANYSSFDNKEDTLSTRQIKSHRDYPNKRELVQTESDKENINSSNGYLAQYKQKRKTASESHNNNMELRKTKSNLLTRPNSTFNNRESLVPQ